MANLHFLQMQILRSLLYSPGSRFSELNISGIDSDHFNYHLKTLLQDKLVTTKNKLYYLSSKGKEYANTMDTANLNIEKQPKVAVMIIASKGSRYLVQKRLKEPYFGYYGFVTGKVRFGEKIIETAARELAEETNLQAKFRLSYILHEHVYSEAGELLEDKIFHVYGATSVKGELKNTKDGENGWFSEKEFHAIKDKFYDEAEILNWHKSGKKFFIEKTYVVKDF